MQCSVKEELKKVAEVKVEEDVSIEEIQAIRSMFIRAGLLVKIEERNIFILSRV